MVARTLANLGLKGFYDLGEDGWDDDMNLNLLTLSVLVQGTAIDKVSAVPGSPSEGQVYILDETEPTNPNKIIVYDDATWKYLAGPFYGWLIHNAATGNYEKFNGTAWVEFSSGGGSESTQSFVLACSDEISNLTTGTAKVTFRMPYAFNLSAVRASVNTAPTGATIIVDINEGGASVLSTKLSIDATEKTSQTAAVPAVISDATIADNAEITIDIDQVGSTVPGKGLKVVLIGTPA